MVLFKIGSSMIPFESDVPATWQWKVHDGHDYVMKCKTLVTYYVSTGSKKLKVNNSVAQYKEDSSLKYATKSESYHF